MSLSDDYIMDVLANGSRKAGEFASGTMKEVKEVMMMDYFARLK